MSQTLAAIVLVLYALTGVVFVIFAYNKKIPRSLFYPIGGLVTIILVFAYLQLPTRSIGTGVLRVEHLLYTLLLVVIAAVLSKLYSDHLNLKKFKLRELLDKEYLPTLCFYFVLTFAQEFIFRTFIFDSIEYITGTRGILALVVSSVLFTVAHLVYRDKVFVTAVTVAGISIGIFYVFIPNFVLISLIHGIAGIIAISQGIVRYEGVAKLKNGL